MSNQKKTQPQTLAEWYLTESLGEYAARLFRNHLASGERVGQAFFNSVSAMDASRLVGTLHDPFYGGVDKTHDAIDFLTQKEK